MKRSEEIITKSFTTGNNKVTEMVNVILNNNGTVETRKGYNTFGEMVDVLWKINKQAKKMKWSAQYTVVLPLKGTKPIYKKTLKF